MEPSPKTIELPANKIKWNDVLECFVTTVLDTSPKSIDREDLGESRTILATESYKYRKSSN